MFKTKKLSFKETVLLLFQVVYSVEYEKQFKKGLELVLNHNISCYQITFTDNNKLQIDNKLEQLTFMSLNDLINNYFIHNNDFVRKTVNFKANCLIKVEKHFDITYYYVYVFSLKSVNDIDLLYHLSNFKYKFNFNKKERKLLFKLKNNYLHGLKYSYNFDYMLDIQDKIKALEKDIKEKEKDLIYFNDSFKLNKKVFFEKLQEEYIETLNDIKRLEKELQDLKELESNLTSSTDNKTSINDYLQNNILY